MKTQKFMLGDIPAILWGEDSNRVYVHVHGKMSRKEFAESFAAIAETKGYQTLSFDLPEHGERTDSERCDVWNGVADLKTISDYAFANWERVSLYACSIGAYFSLNAYNAMPFEKALFQSPIVDMERLVKNMMLWSGVTEAELESKKEIPSPVDTLRWDYYQYIFSHPDRHTLRRKGQSSARRIRPRICGKVRLFADSFRKQRASVHGSARCPDS